MRGIQTPVRNVRRRIFKEIAKFGYEQRNLQDLEDLPYEIIPGEVAKYRDSIYRERAIVGERLRLAMGMSLNPADKPTRITKGIDESNISEKYYEPPLLQVIPSACNECKEKAFIVGEQCQGCMAHPCMEVCPKKAVSFMDFYSYITGLIGQSGRRGALMISISCDHPDLEEFIELKSNLDKVTKANISVRVSDNFMKSVINAETLILKFITDTGEVITKEVEAYPIFRKLAEMN